MGKLPLKWILIGLLVLILFGYVSVQGPGVQCSGSMIYCPGVGCVSGPDKCKTDSSGGPFAIFSTLWGKEQFVDGKDIWPGLPTFSVPDAPELTACPNNTRARDGRCPEFLGP